MLYKRTALWHEHLSTVDMLLCYGVQKIPFKVTNIEEIYAEKHNNRFQIPTALDMEMWKWSWSSHEWWRIRTGSIVILGGNKSAKEEDLISNAIELLSQRLQESTRGKIQVSMGAQL